MVTLSISMRYIHVQQFGGVSEWAVLMISYPSGNKGVLSAGVSVRHNGLDHWFRVIDIYIVLYHP